MRVEAGRLRTRLREFYDDEGRGDPLLIDVPNGAYRVVLTVRAEASVVREAEPPTSTAPPTMMAPAELHSTRDGRSRNFRTL